MTIKEKRGFACMSPEERRRIASMGGKALRPEQRSFSQNRALAASAGKKGGENVPSERRSFSRDPELAAAAGSRGGRAVPANRRSFSQDRALASEAGRKGGLNSKGHSSSGS